MTMQWKICADCQKRKKMGRTKSCCKSCRLASPYYALNKIKQKEARQRKEAKQ